MVQLELEKLHSDLLLLIRVFLHLHIHADAGFCTGEGFDFSDFPVDHIAGILKTVVLNLRVGMIGKGNMSHVFPFRGDGKKASAKMPEPP